MAAYDENPTPTTGATIAHRVRLFRERRGWSQQRLAERMTELGHPINRVTLAKLEGGGTRAENVPLAEVMALAAALAVPPILLFVPLGEKDLCLVGNVPLSPDFLRRWFVGGDPFIDQRGHAQDLAAWKEAAFPVRAFDRLAGYREAVEDALISMLVAVDVAGQLPDGIDHYGFGDRSRALRDLAPADRAEAFDGALRAYAQHIGYMRDQGLRVTVTKVTEEMRSLLVELDPTFELDGEVSA